MGHHSSVSLTPWISEDAQEQPIWKARLQQHLDGAYTETILLPYPDSLGFFFKAFFGHRQLQKMVSNQASHCQYTAETSNPNFLLFLNE